MESSTFANILGAYVQRSLYSHGQLAALSGVPKNSITNWLGGRVSKPHRWEPLLKLAATLSLTRQETDRLLQAAGHETLAELEQQALTEKQRPLFTPWHASEPTAPFQAISDLPYFVGRDTELTKLRQLLQSERHLAIVGLFGMGGVGKTSLAARLAYELRSRYPDGVLWVRLDGSSTMANLTLLAGSYGVDVSRYTTIESRSAVVRGLLADKRVLLVLDNAENSDQVTPLLPPTTGHCRVLLTTRHDLAVLDGWPRLTLRPFASDSGEALTLFAHFLGKTVVAQHEAALLEISQLVGQLPLALAIAAARLAQGEGSEAATIERLLHTLQQNEARLGAMQRENRGVRLTFDLSFGQLPPLLQHFFVGLGAFVGDSFSAEAAAFVAETDIADATRHLQTLNGLSLVQAERNGRYRLHPLLRDYAREKIETDEIYGRMCRFYIQMVAPTAPMDNSLRVVSPALIAAEISNLHAAMQTAHQQQRHPLLLETIRAFFLPLYEHGLWQIVAAEIAYLLDRAEAQHDYDMAAELLTLQSKLLWWQGEDGSEQAQRAVQIASRAEDPQLISDALRELGAWLNRSNRQSEAETVLYQALALATEIDDTPKMVSALNNLGHALLNQNKIAEAQLHLERGIQLAREIGYYRALVILASNLGTLHAEKLGDWETAVVYFAEGAAVGRQHNCHTALMGLLGEWGYQALFFDELERAHNCFAESLTIAEENHHLVSVAVRLADLGEVARRRGNVDTALSQLTEAFTLAQRENMATWQPIIHLRLALLAADRGDRQTAATHFSQGMIMRHQLHAAYDREVAQIEQRLRPLNVFPQESRTMPPAT